MDRPIPTTDAGQGRRQRRLDPDPRVRVALLSAASKIIREEGVQALSVSTVLQRTQLSTRAFYRHFDSKDQLVSAVFLEMARVERMRLRQKMSAASDPVRAVVAWIDGRLDLAFNDEIRSDLRRVSLEAESQIFSGADLVAAAYREILRPLVDELERGKALGLFDGVDPEIDALSLHGTIWACVERQWQGSDRDLSAYRKHIQRFCLRGLGVRADLVADALRGNTTTK